MDIAELLAFSVKNKASDLHLSAGLPPMIRVDGDVRRINIPALEHKQVHSLIYDIMSDKQRRDYEEFYETDFSFEIPGLARFRVNAFNQNRGAGAVFRTIPSEVLTLEDLGAPRIFKELIEQPQGLILVTGPTGSGKSSTLAAIVDHINENAATSSRSRIRSSSCTSTRRGRSISASCTPTRRRSRWRCAPRCGRRRKSSLSAKCATPRRSRSR